ncbi:MAG: bacteriohemerythrin [Candidatus Sedimenticola endophacoides]
MAHLEWSNSLDTGISVIDEQHKRIVDYINELYDAQQTLDKRRVGEVIDELVDYTVSHFAFGESLMEQAGYPFLEPHKKVHGLFVKKVTKFVDRFEAGEDVAGELLTMLQRWLINHIRNEDEDYTEIVRRNMKDLKGDGGFLSRSLKKFFG